LIIIERSRARYRCYFVLFGRWFFRLILGLRLRLRLILGLWLWLRLIFRLGLRLRLRLGLGLRLGLRRWLPNRGSSVGAAAKRVSVCLQEEAFAVSRSQRASAHSRGGRHPCAASPISPGGLTPGQPRPEPPAAPRSPAVPPLPSVAAVPRI